jgi:hypothetical protein
MIKRKQKMSKDEEVPVWYERVPQFSKRHGDRGIKDHSMNHFMSADGVTISSSKADEISDVIFHSSRSKVQVNEDEDTERVSSELEEKIGGIVDMMRKVSEIDLIVVSIFNTAVTVCGEDIQCVSMFTVEGYEKD